MQAERVIRTLHAWMGALILPWVVLAGFTGLYMNHAELISRILPASGFDTAVLAESGAAPQDQDSARAIAVAAMPGEAVVLKTNDRYQGRDVFYFVAGSTDVVVDKATGFHWRITRYQRQGFANDGSLVTRQIRWDRVMDSLHGRGWLGDRLGTWLADLTAVALMLFGGSGIYLFVAPRLRRWRRRRGKSAD